MLSPQELPNQLAITLLLAEQEVTPAVIHAAVAKTAVLVPGLNQQAMIEEMSEHFRKVSAVPCETK